MIVLRIHLFRGIQIADRQHEAIALQPIVQTLLAYLLLNRHRSHCREVLMGLFWGDMKENQARRCLSTTLWRLRMELEPEGQSRGAFIVTNHSGEIGFNYNSDQVWMDVAAFEELASQGLSCPPANIGTSEIAQLEEAAELYTGDLLEGFYANWVLQHRERLRGQYIRCLGRLMHFHGQQGSYEQGIYYGRKILAIDPLREEVHRQMMRFYEQNGARPQAIRQYESCRQILAEELQIEPMPETQALYRQISASKSQTTTPSFNQGGNPNRPVNLQQALQELDQALISVEHLRTQLHHARRAVSQFLNR